MSEIVTNFVTDPVFLDLDSSIQVPTPSLGSSQYYVFNEGPDAAEVYREGDNTALPPLLIIDANVALLLPFATSLSIGFSTSGTARIRLEEVL